MKSAGKTESLVGLAILFSLVAIAAGVFSMQFRYDPSLFVPAQPAGKVLEQSGVAPAASGPLLAAPQGMAPLGPPESFDSETLSEKIDGKAELYLSSGFVRLDCQRFGRAGDPNRWFELFVYDMGAPRNAFSVYSMQRRKEAEKSGVARFAYSAGNAFFFVHGQQYVEIISASADDSVDLAAVAGSFIGSAAPGSELSAEFALFSPEGLVEASISLHMSDVFGFDRLDKVYTAKYEAGAEPLTAFLSDRGTVEAAEALAKAYADFLIQNGGLDRGPASGVPGSRVIEIFDTFEIIFPCGSFFAGVHEAESRDAAEKLGLLLFSKLSGETGGEKPAGKSD